MEKKMQKLIRKSGEFKFLREEARAAIAAYAEGTDFTATILRLAGVGRVMKQKLD